MGVQLQSVCQVGYVDENLFYTKFHQKVNRLQSLLLFWLYCFSVIKTLAIFVVFNSVILVFLLLTLNIFYTFACNFF